MNRKFSEEFKIGAIKLVTENGVSGEQAAKDVGIGYSTLQAQEVSWYFAELAQEVSCSAEGRFTSRSIS